MAVPLAIGDVIHGFARGAFGPDHWNCTKIEAAGLDWIVARDDEGSLSFASGERTLRLLIQVRDEDQCTKDSCHLGSRSEGLTIPGGF